MASTNNVPEQAVRFPYINHSWDLTLDIVKGNYSNDPQIATAQKIALYTGVGLAAIAIFEAFKNFAIVIANAAIALANLANDTYNSYFSNKDVKVLPADNEVPMIQQQPVSTVVCSAPSVPVADNASAPVADDTDVMLFPSDEEDSAANILNSSSSSALTSSPAPVISTEVEKQPAPSAPVVETPAAPVVETPAAPVVETPAVAETPSAPVIVVIPAVVETPSAPVAEKPTTPVVVEPADTEETPLEVSATIEDVVQTQTAPATDTPVQIVETPVSVAPSTPVEVNAAKVEDTAQKAVDDDTNSGASDLTDEPEVVSAPAQLPAAEKKPVATADTELDVEMGPATSVSAPVAAKQSWSKTAKVAAAASVIVTVGGIVGGVAYATGSIAPITSFVTNLGSTILATARGYGAPI